MRTFASVMAIYLLFPVGSAPAQDDLATSIVGTWRIVSHMHKEVASGATANSYGQKPAGYFMYTRGGHVLWLFVADSRRAPASANITDAERVELFKTMAGGGGTYKIEGKRIVFHSHVSWHQLWTGKEQSADAEISEKVLKLTTAPFKRSSDGKDVVVVSTWERVE